MWRLKTSRSKRRAGREKASSPEAFKARPGIVISWEHDAGASALYGDTPARRPAVQCWCRGGGVMTSVFGKARAQGHTRSDSRN